MTVSFFIRCRKHSRRRTSFDGCELLRSNDEAEETASSSVVNDFYTLNEKVPWLGHFLLSVGKIIS